MILVEYYPENVGNVSETTVQKDVYVIVMWSKGKGWNESGMAGVN